MQPLERLYQMAFLVESLELACLRWAGSANAGPFFLFDPFAFLDPLYRGTPADPGIAIALAYSGDIFVELIEVRGKGPSVFEGTAPGQLHHVARLAGDIDATLSDLSARGHDIAFTGRFHPDTRMAFVDTRSALGCWTEVIAWNPDIAGALEMIRDAHRNWDGREPLRRL